MAENGFLLSGAFVDALATNLQNSNGYSKGAAGTSNAILENGDKLLVRLVASAPDDGDFAVYTAESVQLNEEGTGYESTAIIRTYDGGADGSETNYPAYIYERNKTKGLKDSVHEVTYEYVYALSEDRLVFSAASGSGTVSETPWQATFAGESFTWAVPAGGGNDEIFPDILTMSDGRTFNDTRRTVTFDSFTPINYGADDSDPETDERVLASGSTDYYNIQTEDVGDLMTPQTMEITTTDTDLFDTVTGTRLARIFNVVATTETHPNGESGTKFTIGQEQTEILDYTTEQVIWARPNEAYPSGGHITDFTLYRARTVTSAVVLHNTSQELILEGFPNATASTASKDYFNGRLFACNLNVTDGNFYFQQALF